VLVELGYNIVSIVFIFRFYFCDVDLQL